MISCEMMPLLNQLANRFFAKLLSIILGVEIKDSLCGTKAISKENYLQIVTNWPNFMLRKQPEVLITDN